MSFSNIQDFMSFFFVGKYINTEGISVRNIAPSLNDKKDIFSKTAKLVNLAINHNLQSKNSLNYRNAENPNLEETTNAFFDEFQIKVSFQPSKRIQAGTRGRNQNNLLLSDYCSFTAPCTLTAKPLARLANDFVQITNPDAKRFYGSLIAGSYIGNETLLGTVYNNYYNNHMMSFFTKLAQPTQHEHYKMMMFNSEGDLHKYLRDFFKFTQTRPLPPFAANNGGMHASFNAPRVQNGDLDNYTNTEFYLTLSETRTDRWHNERVVLLLDHMDITSYYSVANGLVLSKLHQTFKENNYVIPPNNVLDIANMNYSLRTNNGQHTRSEKFRMIPKRYMGNGQAPTPFIYIFKMVMPRNQTAYILMTNIENVFDASYVLNMDIGFRYSAASFASSESFRVAAEATKNHIDTYFKTVNNEQ